MPVETHVWRIDKNLVEIKDSPLPNENILQNIADKNITVIDSRLLRIGGHIKTDFGKEIDILAIDIDGDLTVIELNETKLQEKWSRKR